MISNDQITEIGRFGQPHGINGELNATIDNGIEVDALRCIVCDIDGINVPFFIASARRKGTNSMLLTIDGINNESEAALLKNKIIYGLADEIENEEDDEDFSDGFYAEDLIGYTITDTDGKLNGEITDIDDSTENILFVVTQSADNSEALIPVADEFIIELDPARRHISVELPQGLL